MKYLFFYLFFPSIFFGQIELNQEKINYYFTYNDYVNKTPNSSGNAYITIKDEKPGYFLYKEIISSDTNKKLKKGYTIWGLEYKGELYHNLLLTNYEIAQDHAFGKFDILGKKYNVIILDTKIDKKAIGYNGNPYGGGLIGAALYNPSKSTWKDKKGNSYKILFYDAETPDMTTPYKGNVFVKLLTPKIIDGLYNSDPDIINKLKKDEYFLEDFIEFVEKENNK